MSVHNCIGMTPAATKEPLFKTVPAVVQMVLAQRNPLVPQTLSKSVLAHSFIGTTHAATRELLFKIVRTDAREILVLIITKTIIIIIIIIIIIVHITHMKIAVVIICIDMTLAVISRT